MFGILLRRYSPHSVVTATRRKREVDLPGTKSEVVDDIDVVWLLSSQVLEKLSL